MVCYNTVAFANKFLQYDKNRKRKIGRKTNLTLFLFVLGECQVNKTYTN